MDYFKPAGGHGRPSQEIGDPPASTGSEHVSDGRHVSHKEPNRDDASDLLDAACLFLEFAAGKFKLAHVEPPRE